jgi:hypothetical protein
LAAIDVNQKADIYETLSSLNLAFAGIVEHLQTMQQTGVFRPKYTRLFQGFAQELQAEINQEFLGTLESLESDDWGRFGKIRDKWEKYLRGEDPKPRKKTRSPANRKSS